MDQIKIGKFIASCRKEQGMTQAALAEKLGISDRAVSKWENGRSMPDSGIMLELCGLLKINVNELLSGEKIMAEVYDRRAEENMIEMKRQIEEQNRQMLRIEVLFGIPAFIAAFSLILVGAFADIPEWLQAVLIAVGVTFIVVLALVGVVIEQKAGYYECQKCGYRLVPTYFRTLNAPHMGRTRLMKCPKCGERSWQKKVLTDEQEQK
ncbi:MAG: helix-turn-helix transcriptional regulator [Lachnospiraceae bacterium]|nr:helix-turn-helix transcriptional regulator [Lachnospiraceae bacterium]